MTRILTTLQFLFCLVIIVKGQSPTNVIRIIGKVKEEKTIEFSALNKYVTHNIGDVAITNHKGELKGTAKAMKGVLLRDILSSVELTADSPKFFSEYYFVCRATDGYKVVYSWNELFNTKIGDTVFLVMEKDSKTMKDHEDGILIISIQDQRTGRRYVKNLESITVGRAE